MRGCGKIIFISSGGKKNARFFKKLLDKHDPLDELILKLARKGTLKVDVVDIGQHEENFGDTYSQKSINSRGRYTS